MHSQELLRNAKPCSAFDIPPRTVAQQLQRDRNCTPKTVTLAQQVRITKPAESPRTQRIARGAA